MARLKKYYDFINEDGQFVIDSNAGQKLAAYMQEKHQEVELWFNNGLFGDHAALVSLELSKFTDVLSKNIIFTFTDQEFMYQIIFTIPISNENFKEGKFSNAFLEIKKYSMNIDSPEASAGDNLNGVEIGTWNSNNPDDNPDGSGQININDFNPEFIKDKIKLIDAKKQKLLGHSNNKNEIPATDTTIEGTPAEGPAETNVGGIEPTF